MGRESACDLFYRLPCVLAMESERHSVSLRDRRLGVRSYTIYGLGTHFRVRALPPEPAKPVSTSHVQVEKTLSNLPGLSGLEARLCARRVWLFCDLSGILRASLWSPNCNFQNANPETRFEIGRDSFDRLRPARRVHRCLRADPLWQTVCWSWPRRHTRSMP